MVLVRQDMQDQISILRQLGIIEPYPASEMAARFLIDHLQLGTHSKLKSVHERVLCFNQLQQSVVNKSVYKKVHRSGSPKVGVIRYLTAKSIVFDDPVRQLAPRKFSCAFQALIEFSHSSYCFVSLDNLFCAQTHRPIWKPNGHP